MNAVEDAYRQLDEADRNFNGVGQLDETEKKINDVREMLASESETAVPELCYGAAQHAAESITHADQKVFAGIHYVLAMGEQQWSTLFQKACHVFQEVKTWMMTNPRKTSLLVIGLGGTACKSTTIANFMKEMSHGFIVWGKSTTIATRFLGFVALMMIRLFISTLVPPTSPGFGIILQAATPETEKWTAMPMFLAASTVAGAVPYVIDKTFQGLGHGDFAFTRFMRRFANEWPLTCWTGPAMNKVFESAGGGKMGASVAVIVAHAAPFMGAQTTNMQRYFLPHPLDTILSQPFGMSEDLLLMAFAEGASNPILASALVTILVVAFNVLQFVVFSEFLDFKARKGVVLNIIVGVLMAYILSIVSAGEESKSFRTGGLLFVALQLLLQLFAVPGLLSVADKYAQNTSSLKLSRLVSDCSFGLQLGSSTTDERSPQPEWSWEAILGFVVGVFFSCTCLFYGWRMPDNVCTYFWKSWYAIEAVLNMVKVVSMLKACRQCRHAKVNGGQLNVPFVVAIISASFEAGWIGSGILELSKNFMRDSACLSESKLLMYFVVPVFLSDAIFVCIARTALFFSKTVVSYDIVEGT